MRGPYDVNEFCKQNGVKTLSFQKVQVLTAHEHNLYVIVEFLETKWRSK